MVIIGSALVTFFVLKRKKSSNNRGIHNKFINFHVYSNTTYQTNKKIILIFCVAEKGRTPRPEPPKITKKKRFTYAEVTEMTNNFERVLGRGGFGMVYHGYVNGTEQVAVKVVSQGSDQGHKQFKAEVLVNTHNLLPRFVGYEPLICIFFFRVGLLG